MKILHNIVRIQIKSYIVIGEVCIKSKLYTEIHEIIFPTTI